MNVVSEGDILARRIRISYIVAAVVAGVVIGCYVYKMVLVDGLTDTGDPAAWGQFGDYIGGLLNPIMAALAFYWLTQSVRIQHRELSDTRASLKESAEAQVKHVLTAERAARISALVGFLSSYDAEIEQLRARQDHFRPSWQKLSKGQNLDDFEIQEAHFFNAFLGDISKTQVKRTNVMNELAGLLGLPYLRSDASASEQSTD